MKGVAIFLIALGIAAMVFFYFRYPPNEPGAQNRTVGLIFGGLLIARGVLSILARRP